VGRAAEAVNQRELLYKRIVHASLEREQKKIDDWQNKGVLDIKRKQEEQDLLNSERKRTEKEIANKILFQQIQEKIEREKARKMQELEFQNYYKKEAQDMENIQSIRKLSDSSRKAQYSELLRQQIEEDTRRKAESIKMSPLERKLNNKQIEAYEKNLPILPAIVPGMPRSPDILKNKGQNPSSKDSCSTRHESLLGKAGSYAVSSGGAVDPRAIIESKRKARADLGGNGVLWNSYAKGPA